ncbi:MAG: glycosyltransferase [Clostridia bacterium]|nr:glycosyltransferase [Clostridia bacterium]
MTVGIAIALYNGIRFLEEQLDSLRLQTRPADRVVLCDDGSTDGTVPFVRQYIEQYSLSNSWQLHENEKNLGYIRNFYQAINLCDTDLIFLCDQDDRWDLEKIRKMSDLMEQRDDISLLSCRYGIMDANGAVQKSFVEGSAREDEELVPVSVREILQAYRWPGMILCLRSAFFREIYPYIQECDVAHDFMFCACAADRKGFFEYGYLGAYHRRHENNTAREEHRISKLLNLDRKLHDISVTKRLWSNFLSANLPVGEDTMELLSLRLQSLRDREVALKEKSLKKIINVYRKDPNHFLRAKSFVCDVWLVLFG